MLVKVAFEEHGDKTKITLRHVGIPAGADGDAAQAGWNESFDKLAEELAKALSQVQSPSVQAAKTA